VANGMRNLETNLDFFKIHSRI